MILSMVVFNLLEMEIHKCLLISGIDFFTSIKLNEGIYISMHT